MPTATDGTNLLARVGVSKADQRLLKAIRCTPACRGLLVALPLVEASLESYFRISSLPRVAAWQGVARTLIERCEALEDVGVGGLGTPVRSEHASVFGRLCTIYPPRLSAECHDRALALLGMLIADACSSGRPLGESVIAGWYTLIQASGRAADWHAFSSVVPTQVSELHVALTGVRSPGLSDLLSNLIAALGRPLLDPPHDPASDDPESEGQSEGEATAETDDDLSEGEDDPEAPPHRGKKKLRGPLDNERARANPVGWLLEAANYAYHCQRFDLIGDRDRLHPEAVKERWKYLKDKFRSGSAQERQYVAFAHVTQRLGQPARVALPLPTDGKRSTSLNVPDGTVAWNCRAALSASADPALDALDLRDRSFSIRRLLDADIADYLRLCIVDRPDASSLAELLGIDTTPEALEAWLCKYRKFLREGKDVHPAYDARWANSLGDIYRYLGAGEAMAFFGGPDLDALPIGMVPYITLEAETLAPVEGDVFRFLAWRMPQDRTTPGPQGSPISINRADFRVGWATCQERTRQARADLRAASNAIEFAEAFNRLTRSRLLAVITLSGHRGTRLSRLTWRALYQHAALLHIYDKNVGEYQSDRGIPVHRRLDQVLAAWQDDLALMHDKARQLDLSLCAEGRRALPTVAASDPVFFQVRVAQGTSSTIERVALRVSSLRVEAQACFGRPLNIGRHFLVSQLIAQRVSAWQVRALTGHSRIHAEVFSDGMHVPPAYALAGLRDSLEKLLDSLDLAPVADLDPSRTQRCLIAPSGPLPSPVDPYLLPSASNFFRILPPPFDPYSTLAGPVVEDLRRRACCVTDLSPGAEFTAAQTLFALLDRVDQEVIFGDLATSVVEVKGVAWPTWERPNCTQPIGMRLNDRSVIALARINDRTRPGEWRNSAVEVGRWARTCHPALAWPSDDFEAYLCLLALALRYRRLHYAPDSLTAASTALPAATFSRRSLLRIAGCDPAPPATNASLGKALRQGNPRTISKDKEIGPLHDVAEALRSVSRIDYPLGGEIQRAKDWKEKLGQIDLKDDLRAAALKKLHEHEISLWEQVNKKEADETSTLAGHLADLLTALGLISPRDDLSEFTDQEWRDWINEAKQALDDKGKDTKAVKEDHPRHFGLRRLVRIARRLGWSAPRGMFSHGGPRVTFDGQRRSAAAVAILSTDHPQIRRLLTEHFDDWPVLQWRAELAARLHEHLPLRSSEQAALVVKCLVSESQMLLIAPGDFSHLKSVHAYRLLECAKQVVELFDKLEDGSIELESKYLFLDNSGWNWSDVRLIDEALVSAMAQVTGEAAVRKHSLRGSAYCRRIWPTWEEFAQALFGASSPRALREMLQQEWGRGFAVATQAARDAGHGLPLVGLVYYSAAWALMHSAQSRALLVGLEPDSGLIKGVLGSTGSIRNAKSLAKAAGKDFDIWGEVARRCVKQMQLPPLVPTEERAVIAARNGASDMAAPPLMSCVRLVAHMLAGGKRDVYANTLGIAKPYAVHLETMLPDKVRRAAITHRRRGDATPDQLSEDRAFMDDKRGRELLAYLATHPLSALTSLLTDLAPYRRNPRDPPASSEQLLRRLQSHLKVLPPPLRLQIRFNKAKYECPLSAEQQHGLGHRLVVGDNPRIGGQPECQVLPAEKPPSPDLTDAKRSASQHEQSELVGRLTVVTRLYAEAFEISHQALKGNLK